MTKSEAITACMPSFPRMPTPTWAAWIMATSLAPSPTAMVRTERWVLMRVTICCFWIGVERHATTVWQCFPSVTRSSCMLSSSITIASASPSMTRQAGPSWALSMASTSAGPTSSSFPAILITFISGVIRQQASAMLMAVCRLSPVRTQMRMPARRRSEMVCPTASCSRSSMPVVPTSSISCSIFSAASASWWSRSLVARRAVFQSCSAHSSNSSSVR
mmetsp:Transcript_17782/g.50054  ORF Transcript_17782/g.50054 Transcript_17782/m.50054 type:complete len:218 (+) Transcript_17782:190-843(+)